MKAVIFHGWGATSQDNWFPWLKIELEKKGYEVFCPDLPDANYPDQDKWLKKALEFDFDKETVVIGHSSGSILILHLLQKIKVKAAYLVSGFYDDLGLEDIKGLFKTPFDYDIIKTNTDEIVILNSDNDPFISIDHAKELRDKLDCALIVFEGMNHLNNGTGNRAFPELLDLITK